MLIDKLITEYTRVILLGDSLQRIYGFIGAVPNLLDISQDRFNLTRIQLNKNYRFASNPQMLKLDSNIRKNAENPYSPEITSNASIDLKIFDNQYDEAFFVVKKALSLAEQNNKTKIAILVKQRGNNINAIIETFEHNDIPYFYGLFTDEDTSYVQFHKKCLYELNELLKSKPQVTKKLGYEHQARIQSAYSDKDNALHNASIKLLEIFWRKVFSDFSFLSVDEKLILIKDTFEHNSLKQYIEFIDTQIIISTVHAAKGLEWDYVILPDMEQDLFPNWYGFCGSCLYREDCCLNITKKNEKPFLKN